MNVRALLDRVRRCFVRWNGKRQLLGPKILRAVSRERPDACFIEIGANDGKMMDPLRATILTSRWHGLVIEPVPELFEQLSANYKPMADRVRAVNAAVGTQDGPLSFHCLRDVAGRPPLKGWARGLGSFHRDVVLKHADRIPGLEDHLATLSVPCLTWDSLCRRWNVDRVDVLLIDTEGSEAEILAQLDFERWRPILLIYEHHHFATEALATLDARLRQAGYLMFREGLDTWCLDCRTGSGVSAALAANLPGWIRRGRYAVPV